MPQLATFLPGASGTGRASPQREGETDGMQQKSGKKEQMALWTELENGLLAPDCFLNLDPGISQDWVACNFFWVLEVLLLFV